MESIESILNKFDEISLTDISPDILINRIDTKFVFSEKKLPQFLKELSFNYKVLSIENKSIIHYNTTYYDTPDFSMYLMHHNGLLNRYKVRLRRYIETKTAFLEIKLKNNKGRTLKNRVAHDFCKINWTIVENEFIKSNTAFNPLILTPLVIVRFKRITLLNSSFNEKITIDTELDFSNKEHTVKINNLVLLEVKQPNIVVSEASSLLLKHKIKSISLSKYCLGVNYLYPHLKKNNFKQKLITLNKIIHDAPINHTSNI
ncbi:MAG: polyphosphate polymerase domain-containing protein [Bacteroidota bacterium]|nr:polyphosphate polymerase domain-containing protein [Bacteroidota bacterium]